jgi:hypothetical protein
MHCKYQRSFSSPANGTHFQAAECAGTVECKASGKSETIEEEPSALALPGESEEKRERYVSVSSSDAGSAVFAAEDLEIHHPQAAPQKVYYFYQGRHC